MQLRSAGPGLRDHVAGAAAACLEIAFRSAAAQHGAAIVDGTGLQRGFARIAGVPVSQTSRCRASRRTHGRARLAAAGVAFAALGAATVAAPSRRIAGKNSSECGPIPPDRRAEPGAEYPVW